MPNAEDDMKLSEMSVLSRKLSKTSLTPSGVGAHGEDKATNNPTEKPSINDSTGIKLLWEKKDWGPERQVFDVTFFNQGWIGVITCKAPKEGKKSGFEFNVFDLEGKEIEVPFPVFLKKPVALSASQDGKTLVVIDLQGNHVTNFDQYIKTQKGWRCKQIVTKAAMSAVTILPDEEYVFSSKDDMFVFDEEVIKSGKGEKKKWTVPLPGEQNYVSLLSATPPMQDHPNGCIVLGNTKTERVSVHDSQGKQLTEFPTQFLKVAHGLCTDSAGDVLICDSKNSTISLFGKEGEYIKKIMKADWCPGNMSVHQDRYLVTRSSTKLYLHEFTY